MPQVYEEVVLPCSREKAFAEMMTIDFIKKSQPNVGINLKRRSKAKG